MGLAQMLDRAGTGEVEIEAGWSQGRAAFGGLVGALLLAAAKARLPRPAPLRSLTVSFVAPVLVGPVRLAVDVLRSGNSVTQMQVTMWQNDTVGAAALVAFGVDRSSAIRVDAAAGPAMPPAERVPAWPSMPGVTPEFFDQLELRLTDGSPAYSGADTSHLTGWMRLRQAPAEFTEELLVLLADSWPPAVLQMMATPKPASSLTWTLEPVLDIEPGVIAPDAHLACDERTDQAGNGYAHTEARIWHPDGRLVAISRQTVTVFG